MFSAAHQVARAHLSLGWKTTVVDNDGSYRKEPTTSASLQWVSYTLLTECDSLGIITRSAFEALQVDYFEQRTTLRD